MPTNYDIGQRIKMRRLELGLTLDDVAHQIGLAKSTIQRYEAGKIEKLKLPVIEAIANVLNVDPSWICCTTDEQNKPASSSESGFSEDEIQFIEWYRNQASDKDKALLRTMRGF